MSVHVYLFLLVVGLYLFLTRLGRLCWFSLRPFSSPGRTKRSTLHRLLKPRTPLECPPVVSPHLPRRVLGQRLLLYVPGVR